MKKLYIVLTITFAALLLSACGGGGSNGSFSNAEQTIAIPNCETYENILDGDTVIQDQNSTSIKTVFDANGTKKVCVLTGSAHILRK